MTGSGTTKKGPCRDLTGRSPRNEFARYQETYREKTQVWVCRKCEVTCGREILSRVCRGDGCVAHFNISYSSRQNGD